MIQSVRSVPMPPRPSRAHHRDAAARPAQGRDGDVDHDLAAEGMSIDEFVASGGSLLLSGGITTNREALTLAGTGVAGQGALANLSGSNTFWGPVTLSAASEIRSLQNGQTLTLASRAGITGAGSRAARARDQRPTRSGDGAPPGE